MVASADFRNIAAPGAAGRPERLFRAAIHAYCCLPRPTRREILQLDDLAVPLLAEVSPAARRFAAAALSECAHVPPRLLARLCDEPAEIAAPLLIRSSAISDIDLIALIGRHGLGHARVIARRKGLASPIAALVRALEAAAASDAAASEPEHEVDRIRRQLRSMMHAPDADEPAQPASQDADRGTRIVMAALSASFAAVAVALGKALGVPEDKARLIITQPTGADLPVALRSLGISEERAFLIVSCIAPARFASVRSIRDFVEDYRALSQAECWSAVTEWRRAVIERASLLEAANSDGISRIVRVS